MSSLSTKFKEKLFKDRIVPLVIFQCILCIPILGILIYAFTTNFKRNDLYDGIAITIVSVILILRSIEHFLLKKKDYFYYYLIFAIGAFLLGLDNILR
ncbi:hypothetical protein [Gottfriedia luciferensis]|uniref:hypothetical protein n=1 Tax=Gottfriedia luciferensis TaxID=178774 RepID=UPI000B450D37|nr:hypothetical protein [Gottfriedia luciferensis]